MKEPARYRQITHDYTLAAARSLLSHSPGHVFHFISGQGTNTGSRFLWARVKGETEQDLRKLGLSGLVCWRPGYIYPAEPPLRRPLLERLMYRLYPLLKDFPGASVSALAIGQAMLAATFEGRRDGTIENREIRALAERYEAQAQGR